MAQEVVSFVLRFIREEGDGQPARWRGVITVSYTNLRAHETPEQLVCRLPLEKKKHNTLDL